MVTYNDPPWGRRGVCPSCGKCRDCGGHAPYQRPYYPWTHPWRRVSQTFPGANTTTTHWNISSDAGPPSGDAT